MNNKLSVYLRAFEEADAVLIHKWKNDFELMAMALGLSRPTSYSEILDWVRSKMKHDPYNIFFAICINDGSDRLIGFTSVNDIHFINRSASGGGIVIGEKDCQDGVYLHDARILVRHYVFTSLGFNRFEGVCLANHPFSPIMLEATGFKLEGIKRQAIYKEGVFHDLCMYSLMKEDYLQLIADNQYTLHAFAKRVAAIRKERKQKSKELK